MRFKSSTSESAASLTTRGAVTKKSIGDRVIFINKGTFLISLYYQNKDESLKRMKTPFRGANRTENEPNRPRELRL
jgi:hypothetical protein